MFLTTFICDGVHCPQKLIVLGGENLASILKVYDWHEDASEFPDMKHYCRQCWPKVAAEIDERERMNES